ncbi:peptidase inhibitor family I36 protein [Microtetraspora malaysiensis]|uniref:peptidase inhibitor family I36 protein n=1 Tax=Microtetraspora malaysiensis TaxID=161358 RepID=UPI003D948D02
MRVLLAIVSAAALTGIAALPANAASEEPTAQPSASADSTTPDDLVVQPYSKGQCEAGKFCIWTISGFRGGYHGVSNNIPDLRNFEGGGLYMNNGSYWNRTGKNWCLYGGINYNNQIGWISGGDTDGFDFSAATKWKLASMKAC